MIRDTAVRNDRPRSPCCGGQRLKAMRTIPATEDGRPPKVRARDSGGRPFLAAVLRDVRPFGMRDLPPLPFNGTFCLPSMPQATDSPLLSLGRGFA